MRWRTVRALALELPEVEAGPAYGVPAVRVRGSLLAWLAPDKKSIVVKIGLDDRARLCDAQPDTFSLPAERQSYATVVVRLANVDAEQLRQLLDGAWRMSAPPSLVAEVEAR